jgi:hypothetical protein
VVTGARLTSFMNPTLSHHIDPVRTLDRLQAVCNQNDRAVALEGSKRLDQVAFVFGIEGARGLVEY